MTCTNCDGSGRVTVHMKRGPIITRRCRRCAGTGVLDLHRTADRFWSFVAKGEGCWEWQGCRNAKGYGVFGSIRGLTKTAHRIAWELTNGPIPAGVFVCHHCDNPPCVRPDHLFLGSAADNTRDMMNKGRAGCGVVVGEQHYKTRLTEARVIEIRQLCAAAGHTHAELAARFGVSEDVIGSIARGQAWKHAPGPRTRAVAKPRRHASMKTDGRKMFILRALRPDQPQTAAEVAAQLPPMPRGVVNVRLADLARRGFARRFDRVLVGIRAWAWRYVITPMGAAALRGNT